MLDRHNRVWLSAQGWQHALRHAPPDCLDDMLAWRDAGWPAVARRAEPDAGDDQACLGLPLPPRPGRATPRLALRIGRAGVERVAPPLTLDCIGAVVPPQWRAAYTALLQDAAASALAFRVFGSAAMQAITGMAYLKPSSDIDLLFYPTHRLQLQRAVAMLQQHAQALPIDGEIVFPTGEAVAWKEWRHASGAASQPRVLAKGRQSVRLATSAELLATLAAA